MALVAVLVVVQAAALVVALVVLWCWPRWRCWWQSPCLQGTNLSCIIEGQILKAFMLVREGPGWLVGLLDQPTYLRPTT